jgi:hypothetical protein
MLILQLLLFLRRCHVERRRKFKFFTFKGIELIKNQTIFATLKRTKCIKTIEWTKQKF